MAVAVVSFAQPAQLAQYQQRHQWPFIMLADPERQAYNAFALKRLSWFQVFSPAALKLYWKLLRGGMRQEAYRGDDIINPVATSCSIAKAIFSLPIAAKIQRTGRRRSSCSWRLIAFSVRPDD